MTYHLCSALAAGSGGLNMKLVEPFVAKAIPAHM